MRVRAHRFLNVFGEGPGEQHGASEEQKPRALTHQAHMVVGHALSINSLEDRLCSYSRQLCMRLIDDPAINSYASNGLCASLPSGPLPVPSCPVHTMTIDYTPLHYATRCRLISLSVTFTDRTMCNSRSSRARWQRAARIEHGPPALAAAEARASACARRAVRASQAVAGGDVGAVPARGRPRRRAPPARRLRDPAAVASHAPSHRTRAGPGYLDHISISIPIPIPIPMCTMPTASMLYSTDTLPPLSPHAMPPLPLLFHAVPSAQCPVPTLTCTWPKSHVLLSWSCSSYASASDCTFTWL